MISMVYTGTLFALHSGDGRVLWRLQLDDADGNSRLFPWRSSHDSHQAPEVLVLSRKGGRASFAVVNAHSGKVVEAGSLPGSIRKVRLLLCSPRHFRRPSQLPTCMLLLCGAAGKGSLDIRRGSQCTTYKLITLLPTYWNQVNKCVLESCSALQVLELPRLVADGVAEQHALILVSEDLSVSVLPAASAARMLLADKPLHFWRHDEDEGKALAFLRSHVPMPPGCQLQAH